MKKILLLSTALVAAAAPAHAGPVAAAAAWVGTTLANGGLAAFALNTALSMGLSAISGALMKQKMGGAGANVSFDVQMGDDLPLSFIVGDYATAGKRKYLESWGKNTRFITEVIEVSALPQGFAAVWVNDEPGDLVAGRRGYVTPSALATPGRVSEITEGTTVPGGSLDVGQPLDNLSDDGRRIWVKWVDGTQAAADPFLTWAFGSHEDYPWTAEMIGRGKTYAIVTTRYDSDTLTSYPSYLFQPAPLPMYDLRFDSTNGGSGVQRWNDRSTWQPTRNPAIISYNIARGIYYGSEWVYGGKNLPAWRLPQAEWIAAINACGMPIDGPGTEPRYRCGLEITADSEPASVLEEIGKAANMKFAEVGGRLKPIVDLPGSAVFSITDGDILITEGQSFAPFFPLAETYNTISATYPEPREKWASKDAPVYVDEDAKARHDGRHLPIAMTYPAVPYASQVQRLERSQMRDYQRQRQHQFCLPPDAYGLEPGIDLVSYSSERNGYINKQFMVEQVQKTPGMNVLVSLREVDPSDYDWSSDFVQPVVITPPVNPRPFVQPIEGLVVTGEVIVDAASRARRSALLVRCNGDEAGVTHIQIEGRIVGQAEITIDTLRQFSAPYAWYLTEVVPGQMYEVRARLLSERTPRSIWSSWHQAQAPAVGVTRDDLDEAVRDLLDDAREFIDETPGVIQGLRDEVAADIELVDTRITNETAALSGDVAAARQLAIDNLLVAQNYTDTSVQSETIARQTENLQLAARIDQITAAPTSSNLLVNGDFADGTTGWTGVTVSGGKGTVTAAGAQQTFAATFSPAEMLQWRVEYSGPAGQVRVAFLNGSGGVIGSEVVTNLAASATAKIGSGQHAPPDGAAQVRWRVTGTGVVIDNAAVTKIDQQTLARIQSLEVAVATDTQALATYKTEVAARFGTTDAAISSEATTRANADSAISSRTTALESTTANHGSRITTTETTLATATDSLAQLAQLTEAESGRRDLVRDGTFARVATYWPGGSLPTASRLIARDEVSSDARIRSVPAPRYYNLLPSDAAGTWRDTDFQSVTPGEVIEVRFDYVRGLATSVVPAERVVFYGPNKAILGTPYTLRGDGFGADWRTASGQAIAPVGAVYAKTQAGVAATGTSAAGITNVSAMRTGAGYASRGEVQTLSQVVADDQQALANYQIAANSRFSSVEAQSQASADALLNTYTRSQTNQAVAGQINTYNAEVVQPALNQRASASAVQALDSRVTATEQGLDATSQAITDVTADVGRFSANGLFRVYAGATPSGASSRIVLAAAASSGGQNTTGGLYLDAVAGGMSRAVFRADLFALATGPTDAPRYPFVVDGTSIRMDADVWIKSLSIGPDKVQVDGMSTLTSASFADTQTNPNDGLWVEVGRLSFTAFAANTKLFVLGQGLLRARASTQGAKTVEMRVLVNGTAVYRRVIKSLRFSPDPNIAEANEEWISILGMQRSLAGSNTIIVQVRQTQDDSSQPAHGSLGATTIYVTEFKR